MPQGTDRVCVQCGRSLRSGNKSKGAKLLIHWDPVRVAYGAGRSAAVAAELERELASFGDYVLRPPNGV